MNEHNERFSYRFTAGCKRNGQDRAAHRERDWAFIQIFRGEIAKVQACTPFHTLQNSTALYTHTHTGRESERVGERNRVREKGGGETTT